MSLVCLRSIRTLHLPLLGLFVSFPLEPTSSPDAKSFPSFELLVRPFEPSGERRCLG